MTTKSKTKSINPNFYPQGFIVKRDGSKIPVMQEDEALFQAHENGDKDPQYWLDASDWESNVWYAVTKGGRRVGVYVRDPKGARAAAGVKARRDR